MDVYKNSGYPPYDILQLACNEGDDGLDDDLKLCMTGIPPRTSNFRTCLNKLNIQPPETYAT